MKVRKEPYPCSLLHEQFRFLILNALMTEEHKTPEASKKIPLSLASRSRETTHGGDKIRGNYKVQIRRCLFALILQFQKLRSCLSAPIILKLM